MSTIQTVGVDAGMPFVYNGLMEWIAIGWKATSYTETSQKANWIPNLLTFIMNPKLHSSFILDILEFETTISTRS
jgi:hypothetical protein